MQASSEVHITFDIDFVKTYWAHVITWLKLTSFGP